MNNQTPSSPSASMQSSPGYTASRSAHIAGEDETPQFDLERIKNGYEPEGFATRVLSSDEVSGLATFRAKEFYANTLTPADRGIKEYAFQLGFCKGYRASCNSPASLVAALEDTATLAYELMERAAKIDRALIAKDGRKPDCELGEIIRLRSQLSKNRLALAQSQK